MRSVQLDKLRHYLMIFEPDEMLPDLVKSTRDIYENRFLLRHLACTDATLQYLAQLVIADAEGGRRFRKVDCLKVLRAIIRNAEGLPRLESDTIRLLFRIYQHLIFKVSESGQWAASVLIKGQSLTDREIQWLIQNCKRSVHPLNRLLLYPEYHPAISAWAEQVYKAGEFPERQAEVIALLIEEDIPPYVDKSDTALILRSISRARLPHAAKEVLLRRWARREDFDTLLDLAVKLEMPSLIRYMIGEVDQHSTTR